MDLGMAVYLWSVDKADEKTERLALSLPPSLPPSPTCSPALHSPSQAHLCRRSRMFSGDGLDNRVVQNPDALASVHS